MNQQGKKKRKIFCINFLNNLSDNIHAKLFVCTYLVVWIQKPDELFGTYYWLVCLKLKIYSKLCGSECGTKIIMHVLCDFKGVERRANDCIDHSFHGRS